MNSLILRLLASASLLVLCSTEFVVRLNRYENTQKFLPNGFTCWNYASDYHGDDCLLNFTLVISDFEGNIFVQPTVLDYARLEPQLPQNGSVYLESASLNFTLPDDRLKGKPSSIAVIVYVRGTNGSGSSPSNYIGHRPMNMAVMDYFEIPGSQLHRGSFKASAVGQLDDVRSSIFISYNLDYEVSQYGPFGNMTCVSKMEGYYGCAPMQSNPTGQDVTGNYLCITTNRTLRQEFIQRQQVFYTFLDTEESSCTFCTFGIDAANTACNVPVPGSEEYNRFETDARWYRSGTIVLGILLGLAILLLLTLCVIIAYLRAQEDDGSSAYKRQSAKNTTNSQPIRRWDESTLKETKPLVRNQESRQPDDNAWQYSPVKATSNVTTITYRAPAVTNGVNGNNSAESGGQRNNLRHGSTQSKSSSVSNGVRREAAV